MDLTQPQKADLSLSPSTRERIRQILVDGTADATRRAYRGDVDYFWSWARLALNLKPCYPIPASAVLQFITDHLYGLDSAIDALLVDAGVKSQTGPHAITTVQRPVSSLSMAHEFQKLENPCHAPEIKMVLCKARKAARKHGWKPNKKKAATFDILHPMLGACNGGERLLDLRDRALLLTAFASDGRHRSEIAAMRVEHLTRVPDGFTFLLPHSKTDQEGNGLQLPILGRAGQALDDWLGAAGITDGFIWRGISRGGNLRRPASDWFGIHPYTVARIVKNRAV